MKNLFKFLMAVAILFTASCAKEDISSSIVANGEAVEVTFSANLPELGTRYGEGESATKLKFFVYQYDESEATVGAYLPGVLVYNGENGTNVIDGSNKHFNFSLTLVKGMRYNILFWADNENSPYEVEMENGVPTGAINVNYDRISGNNESLDAFFGKLVDFDPATDAAEAKEIKLKRPFAQLNAYTDDCQSVKLSGISELTTSSIKIKRNELNDKLNLFTGVATCNSTDESLVEFTGTIPTATTEIGDQTKMHLAMNYLLVNGEKALINVEFAFVGKRNGADFPFTVLPLSGIPVQRNYKTNITGKLLTNATDFVVEILPGFNDYEYQVDENNNSAVAVDSADELVAIAEQIQNGELDADTNIVLGSDIDLSQLNLSRAAVESNWTPIGTSENPFTGTFDGKGYTIKNLALVESEAKEGKAYIGFFGYAKNATIKNVTFENVYINIPCLDIDHSQGHIGAVAGSLEGTSTIENVTVKGDITVYTTQTANGASRVAVIAGGNAYGNVTMKNVHVVAAEGSSLIANNNVGALAGQLQGKMVFENCSSNINVTANKFFAGGLVGIAAGDSYIKDCHTTGNVAVLAGREGRHNDEYRVGGIAGGWADGKTKVFTLEDCSYTGNVSGKNADGTVAEPLDYAGYVGRGYTLSNCAGSKVIIDGTEYVQKYDNVYGVYTINGCTPVSTADELVAALEANEGVLFLNDIKIEPASMSNAYGTTGINVKNGQTIDGNGHTLNIKGAGGTWDSGINTTGGLIKNLTVTGSFRGIFINHTSDHSEKVVLENVTIGGNGTVYTISCDQGLYQTIEATNCTFNGWTSFAKTAGEAKFVNCSFGEGSGYKFCRPYSNTEFVNCTFCPGYAVDTTRATVTFTDCTWEE